MSYDPFLRGPHPVGVRTAVLVDRSRSERRLPVELWYPAAARHAGADLDDATRDHFELLPGFGRARQDAVRAAEPAAGERFPLVLFSHGFGSDRRQSSFLCTHLASHGYVVAAPDHTGNTMADMTAGLMQAGACGQVPRLFDRLDEMIEARPADMSFVLEQVMIGRAVPLADVVDCERVGLSGHSFGGWTALTTTARERRVAAVLPLAPAGGTSAIPGNPLAERIELGWGRDVPSLFVVAERDSLLPLAGVRGLFERTPGPRRMAVLSGADHLHFCDRAEQIHELLRSVPLLSGQLAVGGRLPPFAELCSAALVRTAVCGLGLAHFDATLKRRTAAAQLLQGDIVSTLSRRGIEIRWLAG